MPHRRDILKLSGAALLLAASGPLRAAQPATTLEPPKLPFAENALEPVISARTVGLHYGKHHKGYFEKLNKLIAGKPYQGMILEKIVVTAHEKKDEDIFNNAAQAYNHNIYWAQFEGGTTAPTEAFLTLIKRDFQSLDGLKDKIVAASEKVFGTGWVWLTRIDGKLAVVAYQDAGNPLPDGGKPLLGIDVWEHAYYLDYENRRTEHVKAVLDKLVNWAFVSKQWALQEEG